MLVALQGVDLATLRFESIGDCRQLRLSLLSAFEQLGTAFPVAGEQDDPADQRVRQAAAVAGGERRASHVNEEGSVFGHGSRNKKMLFM